MGNLWQSRRGRSGSISTVAQKEAREKEILSLLNRQSHFASLSALIFAYKPEPSVVPLAQTAIVLDSSAFLRLGSQPDVIDYLNARHAAPIILPGQSIQEFWNNNLNVADTIATGIGKKFEALKSEVEKVDSNFQEFAERFTALVTEFRTSYGYAYDGVTVRRTIALLELLKDKALTSYASRERFSQIALHRKRTKTPPGFRDDGDGDFFIWLDMLDALLIAKHNKAEFDQVVLVTNDKKNDWSREGIAHPILSAEVSALTGVPFETWDVAKLVQKVAEVSS